MEEKKDWEQRIVDYSADLMDKHFPKGECKERGKALVFNAKLITYVMGELGRAREEGYRKGAKDMFDDCECFPIPKDVLEEFIKNNFNK